MNKLDIYEETIIIPTYEVGEYNKNPMFYEQRVYQGSSGKVYPLPIIDKISNEKVNKEYKVVYLENKYLKIMVMTSLGGRVQRALDKTNNYDFIYFNEVIKPALVGLAGPWISGGIEFNWPQHHRPTTFMPVEYIVKKNKEKVTLIISDRDLINGTRMTAEYNLYSDKAYLEVKVNLYNTTNMPQSFLWWANPAVSVNKYTKSIFPPDVSYVFDHGKKDFINFPLANGEYYKIKYKNTDISRYKNIPVPTSYMAYKSEYDFLGNYDYKKQAGFLHIADHNYAPGKKQWTWGNGDFGHIWDSFLTDNNGPYIELMAGVYTDNQPDFTVFQPNEVKSFSQYFLPYKKLGNVKNASKDLILNVEDKKIMLYATSIMKQLKIEIITEKSIEFLIDYISPKRVFIKEISLKGVYVVNIYAVNGDLLLIYKNEQKEYIEPVIANKCLEPAEISSNEELYLAGLHLQKYHHPTYFAEDYYLEGLKRDKEDYRINLVYGNILLEKNKIEEALNCYNNGIKRISQYDDRSISGELYYYKGLAYLFQNDKSKAEEMFYKASWSLDTKSNALLKLAQLNKSNELLQESLKLNALNIKALHLQVSLNKNELKPYLIKYPLDLYFNIQAYNLKMISEEEVLKIFNNKTNNYLDTVQELLENSEVELAINCLNLALKENKYPLFYYYLAYIYSQNNVFETKKYLELAEKASPYLCFPNDLSSALVLSHLDSKYNLRMGKYYLGCFYYDKKEYAEALFLWQKITDIPFPTLYRNLGIVTYNYENNNQKAQEYYEKAFNLDIDDMTVLLEYDQLKKLSKVPLKERLDYLNKYQIFTSDALLIEYLSLLNDNQEYQKVLEILSKHKFHIWEGGEGKVAYEYEKALINLALKEKKTEYLLKALDYPLNLGEGKIIFNKQNHIYYLLGYLLEIKGHKEESLKYYKMATHGEYKITNGLFYNDINLEIIFFQYLAFKKLNKVKERKEFKIKLENYLQKNEGKTLKMDYFAISYPNISVFKEDLKAENIVYCSFIKILLLLLKGKTQIALRDFNLFEKANPYFKTYLKYSVDLVNIFG